MNTVTGHVTPPALQLGGLRREFSDGSETVVAVAEATATIDAGTVTSIIGPSGSGKTTLLQLLGLLDTPTAGKLAVLGQEAARMSAAERTRLRRDRIGFVFQHFNLVPTLTARENVEAALVGTGASRQERRERSSIMLDRVGLADRAGHLPQQLSGGEQQRVAIARALVGNPAIILADEPTGNLDEQTGQDVIELLLGLVRTSDTALVMITHDPAVARRADHHLRMQAGHLEEVLPEPEPPAAAPVPQPAPGRMARIVRRLRGGRRG